MLASELGRDALAKLKEEPFSAGGLAKKEQALGELREILAKLPVLETAAGP